MCCSPAQSNHTKQLLWEQRRNSWLKHDFSNRFKSITRKHESCSNSHDVGGCRGSRGCGVLVYGANSQGSAGAQDLPVPACQTPSPCQKVSHVLISTHTFCRGRCFCSPELVLNTQVQGDEAQVTTTMLPGVCTPQMYQPILPPTPLKEKLDIKHL